LLGTNPGDYKVFIIAMYLTHRAFDVAGANLRLYVRQRIEQDFIMKYLLLLVYPNAPTSLKYALKSRLFLVNLFVLFYTIVF
jgi:hypothetical protein